MRSPAVHAKGHVDDPERSFKSLEASQGAASDLQALQALTPFALTAHFSPVHPFLGAFASLRAHAMHVDDHEKSIKLSEALSGASDLISSVVTPRIASRQAGAFPSYTVHALPPMASVSTFSVPLSEVA